MTGQTPREPTFGTRVHNGPIFRKPPGFAMAYQGPTQSIFGAKSCNPSPSPFTPQPEPRRNQTSFGPTTDGGNGSSFEQSFSFPKADQSSPDSIFGGRVSGQANLGGSFSFPKADQSPPHSIFGASGQKPGTFRPRAEANGFSDAQALLSFGLSATDGNLP
ncbi:expressed unknown protein (Partial), partial [Seminavis robusta]